MFTQIGHIHNAQSVEQLITQLGKRQLKQSAFESFQRANSLQDMLSIVKQYPFMLDIEFIQLIERVIAEQVPSDNKFFFEERLSTLRQIAAQK